MCGDVWAMCLKWGEELYMMIILLKTTLENSKTPYRLIAILHSNKEFSNISKSLQLYP